MNKILITILFFCTSLTLSYAQNIQKAMELLDKKEFDQAKAIFSKATKKKKAVMAARYGYGKLYADTAYKRANLGRAHRNLNYVLKRWKRLTPKEIKKYNDNYNLNYRKVFVLDSMIQARAYAQLLAEPTAENKTKFEKDFKDAPIVSWMRNEAAKVEFKKLHNEQNPFKIETFLKKYPETNLTDSATALAQAAWMNFYDQVRFDGDHNTLKNFEKKYPEHRVPQDTLDYDKRLAELARKLSYTRGFKQEQEVYYRAYLEKAGKKRTIAYNLLLRMLETPIKEKKWDKALSTLAQYKTYFRSDDKKIISLEKILKQDEIEIKIERLNDLVNTEKGEYIPIISADNQSLFFCSFQREGGAGLEDIFVSEYRNGDWEEPKIIKELSTEKGYEAPLAVSTDGNSLLFFQNRKINISKRTQSGWAAPKQLPEPINTKFWQGEAQMTSDGRAMIFVSDRPGGEGHYNQANRPYHGSNNGNIDIYVAYKRSDGSWETPVNLGSIVNTPFCERGIFLHPDMKTLYFSSDGHGGIGGMDIYKTTRLREDSWTEWSEPVNLGKSINTVKDDWGYKISTDGTKAYFAAEDGKDYDLFVMDLPASIRPQFIATISGRLLDTKGNPIHGTIKWENLSTGKEIGEAESNPTDGAYFLVVQLGKNYGYFVQKEGYFPASSNIDLRKQKTSINIKHDIILQSIEEMKEGQPVRLNNLFFDTDKYALKPESFPELKRVANLLKKHPELHLEIGGHTDNQGGETHNQTLSLNRAKATMDYLVKQGCNKDQLSKVGYGQSSPIASNKTSKGRALNRRVEVRVK